MENEERKNDKQEFNFENRNKYIGSTFNYLNIKKDNALRNHLVKTGGSLGFITTFIIVLLVWIGFNLSHPFSLDIEPYQYLTFNLIFAVVSLTQGLIINLSQKHKDKIAKLHKNTSQLKIKILNHEIMAKH